MMTQATQELVNKRIAAARVYRRVARKDYTPEPVRVCLQDAAADAMADVRIIVGFDRAHADN